jgi:hypothetical protein
MRERAPLAANPPGLRLRRSLPPISHVDNSGSAPGGTSLPPRDPPPAFGSAALCPDPAGDNSGTLAGCGPGWDPIPFGQSTHCLSMGCDQHVLRMNGISGG